MKLNQYFVLLCSILTLGFTSSSKKEIDILGIGDSITTGYGLDVESSYSFLVYKYLEEEYPNYNYNYQNKAVNGQTSSELLNNLSMDPELIKAVSNAEVIMLSIGSNDILYLLNDLYLKCLNQNCLVDQNNLYDQFNSATTLIMNNLKYLIDYFNYKHPQTKVIIMPFYNPYNKLSNYPVLESALTFLNIKRDELNNYLIEYTKDIDNIVVLDNIVSQLENNTNVLSLYSVDPHPNKAGHQLIYENIITLDIFSFLEIKSTLGFPFWISLIIIVTLIIIMGYLFTKKKGK